MPLTRPALLAGLIAFVFNPGSGVDDAASSGELMRLSLLFLAVLGLFTAVLITRPSWGAWFQRIPRPGRISRWRRQLAQRGIEGLPADLLCAIATKLGRRDACSLIRSRIAFEHTIIECDSLIGEDRDRLRALDELRHTLGWDGISMSLAGRATLLEEDLELELHGVGASRPVAHRCLVIHCDERSVVFRLLDGDEEAPWEVGDEVEGVLWRENDAAYRFRSRVQETRWLGENFISVETPQQLDREQKRLHLRAPTDWDAVFLHVPGAQARAWLGGENLANPLMRGTLLDVSAGGMRIRTRAPLLEGDYLSFRELPFVDGNEVLCRVVACRDHDEDGEPCCGLRFIGMPALTRDAIAQKVFRSHRELLQLPGSKSPTSALLASNQSGTSDEET